jgi:hypothetical protein
MLNNAALEAWLAIVAAFFRVPAGLWHECTHRTRRRARREIPKSTRRRTANSAERTLTAVLAVPHPGLWEKSAASIGSNGSTSSEDFSEIEAAIHRLCDARNDDDGNGAARLSDLREYLPERWPC